jgi:hypothetical protein
MPESESIQAVYGRASGASCLPVRAAVVVRGEGGAALFVAPPGTPVHAVAGGRLRRQQAQQVIIDGDDLRAYSYQPVVSVDLAGDGDGQRVEAGATIGRLPGEYPDPLTTLTFSISSDGESVDAADTLVGLPEPASHPGAAMGSVLGIDPGELAGARGATGSDGGGGARA